MSLKIDWAGCIKVWVSVCLLAMISACAGLMPEFDPPQVSVESVESLKGDEGMPRFLIKLRIANPNKQPLDIVGISYSVRVLDKELLSGVTNQVPVIEPYTDELIELKSSLKLIQIVRLIAGLTGSQRLEELDYRLSAKIDFNGFVPTQKIEEIGTINLGRSM